MTRLQKSCFWVPLIFTVILTAVLAIAFPESFSGKEKLRRDVLILFIAASLVLIQILVLFLGTPYYMFLRSQKAINLRNILLGGTVIGAVAGFAFVYVSRYHGLKMQLIVIGSCSFCGLIIAYMYWIVGIKSRAH